MTKQIVANPFDALAEELSGVFQAKGLRANPHDIKHSLILMIRNEVHNLQFSESTISCNPENGDFTVDFNDGPSLVDVLVKKIIDSIGFGKFQEIKHGVKLAIKNKTRTSVGLLDQKERRVELVLENDPELKLFKFAVRGRGKPENGQITFDSGNIPSYQPTALILRVLDWFKEQGVDVSHANINQVIHDLVTQVRKDVCFVVNNIDVRISYSKETGECFVGITKPNQPIKIKVF